MLYHRAYELLIGTPDEPGQVAYGNQGRGTPLRVVFDVTKNQHGSANKAKIGIFGLAEQSRTALREGMLVLLSAGYQGAMGTLFGGVVAKVTTSRSGAEIATTLECGDGESAITQTRVHGTYPAGTPIVAVLTEISRAMGLVSAANPTGLTQGSVVGLPADTLPRALVLAGPCAHALTLLCRPRGLSWSIQNGALQIVPKNHHAGVEAELVSGATGLLGVPSKHKMAVEFEALLNPKLAPDKLVLLQSETFTGTYKIVGGQWQGDTHDQKWSCTVQAVELPGVSYLAPLPVTPLR